MNIEEYVNSPLWPILVETVHAMVMFPHHKAYTRETILSENLGVSPEELAAKLNIPVGEALVILYELRSETSKQAE